MNDFILDYLTCLRRPCVYSNGLDYHISLSIFRLFPFSLFFDYVLAVQFKFLDLIKVSARTLHM